MRLRSGALVTLRPLNSEITSMHCTKAEPKFRATPKFVPLTRRTTASRLSVAKFRAIALRVPVTQGGPASSA